jgi:RsiW-degrading membrane proteinase PrsW (M82 family)
MSNEHSETIANPRQKVTIWLTITTWLCLLWVIIAFCTLCASIDQIDFYGDSETKNQPLELLFDSAFITGFAALPVGFFCGLYVLLLGKGTKLRIVVLPPTLVFGLLLLAIVVKQYQMSQRWTNPPTVHVVGQQQPE